MKRIKRNNKALMILSLIFFIGIMVFGVAPYMINGGSMWDYSRFTRAISIIVGIGLFLVVFSYFYIAVIYTILFKGFYRYARILEVISMIAILQYVISDETLIEGNIRILILGIVGLSIIIIDVSSFLYFRSEKDTIKINLKQKNWIENASALTNKQDGDSLLNIAIGIVLLLFIADKEMGHFSSYIGLIAVNMFLLYKYAKLTKQPKKNIYRMSIITATLSIASITLLETLTSFFSSDEVLYIFMVLVPTLYLYPSIIKNYYIVTWKNSLD